MRPKAFLLLHSQHDETSLLCHGDEFRSFMYFYVAVSNQVCQRHFQMIHQPDNTVAKRSARSIIFRVRQVTIREPVSGERFQIVTA